MKTETVKMPMKSKSSNRPFGVFKSIAFPLAITEFQSLLSLEFINYYRDFNNLVLSDQNLLFFLIYLNLPISSSQLHLYTYPVWYNIYISSN